MKTLKNLVFVFAFALSFVSAMSMTKASASEVTEPTQGEETTPGDTTHGEETTPSEGTQGESSSTGIALEYIAYDAEMIVLTADKQVYFQIVKSNTQTTGLKPANWIRAAKDTQGRYCIDFSATANSKDAFFAVTTDCTEGTAEKVITVDAVVKSMKIGLNYGTETITNGLTDIISTLNIKGIESDADDAEADPKDYALVWKRGANGYWDSDYHFDQLQWDMLKASNSTLYVATYGTIENGSGEQAEIEPFRLSKETKVKIPKSAKAPTVKVDFVKGTVALKNGMQVREVGKEAWLNVSPYDKSEDNAEIFNADATVTTKTKVSNVVVGDLVTALETEVAAGDEIALEVRTAATTKKFPSNIGVVKFNTPAAAPTVVEDTVAITYKEANKTEKIAAEYVIDFSKFFTPAEGTNYSQYEYVLVGKESDGLNLAKQKWTKLPEDSKVNLAKNIGKDTKYFKSTDEKTASGVVKYESITAIYIRLAAVKATKTTAGVFASAYDVASVEVSKEQEYTVGITMVEGITVSYSIGDGTKKNAKAGDEVTVTYELAEGYELTSIVVKDAKDQTVSFAEGKFVMPASNVTITASVQAAEATE